MCWYTAYCRFAVCRILQFSLHVESAFLQQEIWTWNVEVSILERYHNQHTADLWRNTKCRFSKCNGNLRSRHWINFSSETWCHKKGLKMNPWLLAKYVWLDYLFSHSLFYFFLNLLIVIRNQFKHSWVCIIIIINC